MSYKETEVDIQCSACGCFRIVQKSSIPYRPAHRSSHGPVFGPASRNVSTEKDRVINGYHCPECGLEYNIGVINKRLEND